MDVVLDKNRQRRIGAHGTIKPTSAWDLAIDIDSGKGEKRQLLGKAGDFDVYAYQRHGSAGGRYSQERRQPKVYNRPFIWDKERDIGNIPSVIQSPITTGPMRTLSPQLSVHGQGMTSKRSTDDFQGRYPSISERQFRKRQFRALRTADWGPYSKWVRSKLGTMTGQAVKITAGFPIIQQARQRVLKILRGR